MNFSSFKAYAWSALLCTTAALSSCSKDETEPAPVYNSGAFLISQSTSSNASTISYFSRETNSIIPDLFNEVNGRSLDDGAQAMVFANDRAYVVGSTNKVEIVNGRTFTSLGTINNLQLPNRFIASGNQKGYVTEWISNTATKGRVAVVNLGSNAITKTVQVDKQPTSMVLASSRLFVANTGSNKVSVINAAVDTVFTSITVGDNPNSMISDASGASIWVLCGGKTDASQSTAGSLYRINVSRLSAQKVFDFPGSQYHPSNLAYNNIRTKLLFQYNGVYSMDVTTTELPSAPLISRNVTAMGQDQVDGLLYLVPTSGSTSGKWVVRYKSDGTVVDSFEVASSPSSFLFK